MIIKLILTVAIIALQCLDGWSTYYDIKRRGALESNPAVSFLIKHLGLYFGLLVAKGWAVAVILAGWERGWWASDVGTGVLFFIALAYILVAINNLKITYPE